MVAIRQVVTYMKSGNVSELFLSDNYSNYLDLHHNIQQFIDFYLKIEIF